MSETNSIDTDSTATSEVRDTLWPFPPVKYALIKCLILMLKFTGWSILVVIALQLILGLLPAGFVFLQGHGPRLASEHGLTFLLLLLGLMYFTDGLLHSIRWPFEMNQMDRTRAKMVQFFQDKIAAWPDMAMHEWPKFVSKKTESKQAVNRATQLVGSLRGFIASAAATIPLIFLAVNVNPWFPIILLAGTIPSVMIQIRFDRVVWDLEETFAGVRQRIDSVGKVATAADFAKDIRTFNMQNWISTQWYSDQFRIIRALAKLRYRSGYFLGAASIIQSGTAVLTCILFIDQDRPVTIVLVLGVLMNFVQNFYGMLAGFHELMSFRGPSKSLMTFLSAVPPPRHKVDIVRDSENAIEMEQLCYSYPDSHEVLHGLTCVIPQGKVTCIVGPNGAGKSTLIKVLTGLYSPTSGKLREQREIVEVAVMNQDFARFPLSLRENLACGRTELMDDDEALLDALHCVGLQELQESRSTDVFQPRRSNTWFKDLFASNVGSKTASRGTLNGLDSYLYIDGDGNGTQLSGGQWQRLGIARTLLHAQYTGFALFDEPTSALDPFAEAELLNLIIDSTSDGTLVLVTHRLFQVAKADHVLVIEDGVISAMGSPSEVYRTSKWYSEAFDMQAAGYISANDGDHAKVKSVSDSKGLGENVTKKIRNG